MAKKTETLYSFQPDRDLTPSEVTEMLKKLTANMVMTQDVYDKLHEDLKDVFKPIKDAK